MVRATISDVAKRAGLSRSSVSNYLTGNHRNLGTDAGDTGFTYARSEREAGFIQACRQKSLHGTVLPPPPLAMDEVRPELELFVRGKLYAQQFTLESLGVTAIIALNDLLATGISLGLQDEGIDVPRDVSVVGIDDVLMAQMTAPKLTTIGQPIREMAETAVACLLDCMRGDAVEDAIIFQPQIVVRQSSGSRSGLD